MNNESNSEVADLDPVTKGLQEENEKLKLALAEVNKIEFKI